jgi:hypothetical protein
MKSLFNSMTCELAKVCSKCGERKSLDDFYKAGEGHTASACKTCHRAAMALRRRVNPEVQAYDRIRARQPERQAHLRQNARRWRERHPEAYRAQTAVNNAVRDGRLTRQACYFCESTKHVHAHHRDYSKPLEVIWLCAKCHHRLHAAFPETEAHGERRA